MTGSHLVQCHLQMENSCTETSLVHLMSYVPENKATAYFPITKNHVLSVIMFDVLVVMLENKPMPDPGHLLNIQALCYPCDVFYKR